jgi:hypothetical protein
MWGLFVGVSLAVMLYSFIEEWQQRRLNKKHLTKMRKDFVAGRHWDVRKGQWDDDWSQAHEILNRFGHGAEYCRLVELALKAKKWTAQAVAFSGPRRKMMNTRLMNLLCRQQRTGFCGLVVRAPRPSKFLSHLELSLCLSRSN